MDELKEYLIIAIAAASLVDERSGVIRATAESVDARAREIRSKVEDVLRMRAGVEALYD